MIEELALRLLTPADFSQMYRTFMEAFSKYSVKMDVPKDAFRERIESKLNISYDHSVGAFHGEKLVGFIFNSLNVYEGQKSAYNGGTGVLRQYWGNGLTKSMYDYVIPKMKKSGVQRCILEVITSNKNAIRAYEKCEFSRVKEFKCFKLKGEIPKRKKYDKLEVLTSSPKDLNLEKSLCKVNPSMLDSYEQLLFNLKNETCLNCFIEDEFVGYVIFQHKSGRISQIATKSTHRRRGIGTYLLEKARVLSGDHQLTMLNIDAKENGIVKFFQANGFVNELDQYEMERNL